MFSFLLKKNMEFIDQTNAYVCSAPDFFAEQVKKRREKTTPISRLLCSNYGYFSFIFIFHSFFLDLSIELKRRECLQICTHLARMNKKKAKK